MEGNKNKGMGRPLVANSFDAWVTYPLVYKLTPYVDVHPNYVTLLCIVFKVLCLAQSWAFPDGFDAFWFGVWMTMERLTDCLDGEIARYYKRQSKVGHYMDKVSDVCFRYSGVAILCYRLAPILPNPWALLTLLLCLSLPGVYVYEAFVTKRIKEDMNTPADSWAIYVEDNATLLCVALPWLLAKAQPL